MIKLSKSTKKGCFVKELLFASLLVLTSISTCAETSYQAHEKYCISVASLAEAVMEGRQANVSVLSTIKANDIALKDYDENTRKIPHMIIEDAYQQPSYSTEEYQKKAVTDFSAKYYVGCMAMYK